MPTERPSCSATGISSAIVDSQLTASAVPPPTIGSARQADLADRLGSRRSTKGRSRRNVFDDPKSSETSVPVFLGVGATIFTKALPRGTRHQTAIRGQSCDPAADPSVTVYGERMLDHERHMGLVLGTQPFPTFPLQEGRLDGQARSWHFRALAEWPASGAPGSRFAGRCRPCRPSDCRRLTFRWPMARYKVTSSSGSGSARFGALSLWPISSASRSRGRGGGLTFRSMLRVRGS